MLYADYNKLRYCDTKCFYGDDKYYYSVEIWPHDEISGYTPKVLKVCNEPYYPWLGVGKVSEIDCISSQIFVKLYRGYLVYLIDGTSALITDYRCEGKARVNDAIRAVRVDDKMRKGERIFIRIDEIVWEPISYERRVDSNGVSRVVHTIVAPYGCDAAVGYGGIYKYIIALFVCVSLIVILRYISVNSEIVAFIYAMSSFGIYFFIIILRSFFWQIKRSIKSEQLK